MSLKEPTLPGLNSDVPGSDPGSSQGVSDGPKPVESDLEKVVEESKATLAAEEEKPLKKRGRPVGSTNKPKEESPAPQAVATLAPILSHAIKIPYEIAARNTKFEGFRLQEDEAQQLSALTDQVLQLYMPSLGEKATVLVVCLGSFTVVTLSKYAVYQAWLEEKKASVKKENHDSENNVIIENGPPISSHQFFPNQ